MDEANAATAASTATVAAERSHDLLPGGKNDLEELCVNTIRFLAVDAVEKANAGHPGTPMGLADIAYVIQGGSGRFFSRRKAGLKSLD